MYLSRVEINYYNRKISKELNHLGAYHNWVENSFPEEFNNNIRSRKLWRIDSLNNKEYLLLISETKPNIEMLEKYGKKGTAEYKNYDDFLNQLHNGQRLKFRVVLNPVVSKVDKDKKNKRGRVFPLIMESDQLDYLFKRSEKNGFSINKDDVYLLKSSFEVIKRKNHNAVKIVKAEYQGELTIINKEKFLKILKYGLGKKKAYGCGMMTVIPME